MFLYVFTFCILLVEIKYNIMKKVVITMICIVFSTIGIYAQIKEGSVTYKMEFQSDHEEQQMAITMMENSTMGIYFKGNYTRADVSMGTMMKIITVTNSKDENVLLVMDVSMMGMKYAVKSNLKEFEKYNDEKESEVTVQLVAGSKDILGYSCKKALVTDEKDNETIYWYTEGIKISKRGQSYLNEDIPGFPLEYEMFQDGMKIKMMATKFVEEIVDEEGIFNMEIPEGFEEKTLEEFMSGK